MATLTGYKQAIIAYSVDRATREPLDADGRKVSESGKRQAIALLTGAANPAPALYEVILYFEAGAVFNGDPTRVQDFDQCPPGTTAVWILTTGFWDNSAQWINSETWNY